MERRTHELDSLAMRTINLVLKRGDLFQMTAGCLGDPALFGKGWKRNRHGGKLSTSDTDLSRRRLTARLNLFESLTRGTGDLEKLRGGDRPVDDATNQLVRVNRWRRKTWNRSARSYEVRISAVAGEEKIAFFKQKFLVSLGIGGRIADI
jgi:hypothetical protein